VQHSPKNGSGVEFTAIPIPRSTVFLRIFFLQQASGFRPILRVLGMPLFHVICELKHSTLGVESGQPRLHYFSDIWFDKGGGDHGSEHLRCLCWLSIDSYLGVMQAYLCCCLGHSWCE